jgi:hypothetical protein
LNAFSVLAKDIEGALSSGNGVDVTVTVTAVNDAPTLTVTAANATFTEATGSTQAAAVSVFSAATISAVEAADTITSLTFTVSGLVDGANEKIYVDGTAITLEKNSTGTSATNAMTYSVTIVSGVATVALTKPVGISATAAQTLVNSITYHHRHQHPCVAEHHYQQ